MAITHDPYLLQTHSQARIDTGLAKPQGVACTSSLMPLPDRLSQPHQPASIEQRRHNQERRDDAGHLIGLVASAAVLLLAFASFAVWAFRVLL